jgi:hypothetical protein
VGVIEAQDEPSSSFSFVTFLMDISRQAAFTSPVAFGQDEGSQRSGVTLTLRLWPLIQQVKTTRVYWRTGLVALHRMGLAMAKARDIGGKLPVKLLDLVVKPNFWDLVPQDRQLLIDEVSNRAAHNLISPEEAIARFGVKAGTEADELARIREWLEFKNSLDMKKAEAQAKVREAQFGQQGAQPKQKPNSQEA